MIYLASQLIAWSVYRLVGKYLMNLDLVGQENFKNYKTRGVLFVSSHHSSLDPFLIGGCIPMKYYIKTKGFRYMTLYKYIWRRPYSLFIVLQGAYPIYPKKGELKDVLKKSISISKKGYNILMFPSGRKREDNGQPEAKPGVAFLAKELNPQIVPINISGTYKIKFTDLFKRNRKLRVSFGKPFFYKEVYREGMDLKELAGAIKERTII